TAYHLLTGKAAVDALARAAAIVAGKPDPLRLASVIKPEIPIGVATVIHSALALNPDQRFASAKAMRQALEHAVSEIASDEVEDAPVEIAAAVAVPVVPIVNSAETENFPALEAFAEAVNAPENDGTGQAAAVEIFPSSISSPSRPSQAFPHSTAVIDAPTKVSAPNLRKSRVPIAALAAALIGGILAIFYFTAGANTEGESNQNPVVQTISATEATNTGEQPAAAVTVSPTPLLEAVSQVKTKPSAAETTVEKKKDDESPIQEEPVEESNSVASSTEPSRPAPPPAKAPRRTQPQPSGESRSRVAEESSVSDIESIFTGQPPDRDDDAAREQRQEERRRRIDQMTDEELREFRRERRQRRRERQNQQSIPPFRD
ncbi:MAG TPA: hypothetical protein VF692_11235, partial [Pyrinomonadaceae bacterium]